MVRRRRRSRSRRNPLYESREWLQDAADLVDIITNNAKKVMGSSASRRNPYETWNDEYDTTILPEGETDETGGNHYTPLNIVAHALIPPGADAHYDREALKMLIREELARPAGKPGYRGVGEAFRGETGEDFSWDKGFPIVPDAWTQPRTIKKYGVEMDGPSHIEDDAFPWQVFGAGKDQFKRDLNIKRKLRRLSRRRNRRRR